MDLAAPWLLKKQGPMTLLAALWRLCSLMGASGCLATLCQQTRAPHVAPSGGTKSWSLQLGVMCAEVSSPKRPSDTAWGPWLCVSLEHVLACAWLGRTCAEGPHVWCLHSVGWAWERRHEYVCGVHAGRAMCLSGVSSRDRCYIPGWSWSLVATTHVLQCRSSWQSRAFAPHVFCRCGFLSLPPASIALHSCPSARACRPP